MQPKRGKYDTNPLEEDFANRANEVWGRDTESHGGVANAGRHGSGDARHRPHLERSARNDPTRKRRRDGLMIRIPPFLCREIRASKRIAAAPGGTRKHLSADRRFHHRRSISDRHFRKRQAHARYRA
jgi:hypothetical protein